MGLCAEAGRESFLCPGVVFMYAGLRGLTVRFGRRVCAEGRGVFLGAKLNKSE